MAWTSAWPHSAPAALRDGERAVVLIEDHLAYAEAFSEALAEAAPGVRVVVFARGEPAIHWLTDATTWALPRAVFLDLGLPDMTGLAVLSFLRQEARFRSVPVIVLTGSSAPEDVRRTALLEATMYEVKPDDWEGLLALVGRCQRWLR